MSLEQSLTGAGVGVVQKRARGRPRQIRPDRDILPETKYFLSATASLPTATALPPNIPVKELSQKILSALMVIVNSVSILAFFLDRRFI